MIIINMSALITISTHCISDLLHSGNRHQASCKWEDREPVENPPSENLKQMLIFENPPSDYEDLDMKVKVGQYIFTPLTVTKMTQMAFEMCLIFFL